MPVSATKRRPSNRTLPIAAERHRVYRAGAEARTPLQRHALAEAAVGAGWDAASVDGWGLGAQATARQALPARTRRRRALIGQALPHGPRRRPRRSRAARRGRRGWSRARPGRHGQRPAPGRCRDRAPGPSDARSHPTAGQPRPGAPAPCGRDARARRDARRAGAKATADRPGSDRRTRSSRAARSGGSGTAKAKCASARGSSATGTGEKPSAKSWRSIRRRSLDPIRSRAAGQARPGDDLKGGLEHRLAVHDAAPDQQAGLHGLGEARGRRRSPPRDSSARAV